MKRSGPKKASNKFKIYADISSVGIFFHMYAGQKRVTEGDEVVDYLVAAQTLAKLQDERVDLFIRDLRWKSDASPEQTYFYGMLEGVAEALSIPYGRTNCATYEFFSSTVAHKVKE